MPADRDHIGVGQREFARALRAIGEEDRAIALDLVERLDHARFIIDVLDSE